MRRPNPNTVKWSEALFVLTLAAVTLFIVGGLVWSIVEAIV